MKIKGFMLLLFSIQSFDQRKLDKKKSWSASISGLDVLLGSTVLHSERMSEYRTFLKFTLHES